MINIYTVFRYEGEFLWNILYSSLDETRFSKTNYKLSQEWKSVE